MTKQEAVLVSTHLESKRYSSEQIEALAAHIEDTALAPVLDLDTLEGKEEWVENITEKFFSDSSNKQNKEELSTVSETPMDSVPSVESTAATVLHIGQASLGRRNLSRKQRQADYEDAFNQAVNLAIAQNVSAVLQTGDLFHSRSPSGKTVDRVRNHLTRLKKADIPFYLTYGQREVEARTDHVENLEEEGLMTYLGGQTVSLSPGAVLHGIDTGSPKERAEDAQSSDGQTDAVSLFAVADMGGEAIDDSDTFDAIEAASPVAPAAYFVGGNNEPIQGVREKKLVSDPGATENTLGKRTLKQPETPDRGVCLYTILDNQIGIERHQLEVREFKSISLTLDQQTTKDDIKRAFRRYDFSEMAVLVELTGERNDEDSLSRKAIQSLVADQSFCARVWDERKRCSKPSDASGDDIGSNSPSESDTARVTDDRADEVIQKIVSQTSLNRDQVERKVSHLTDRSIDREDAARTVKYRLTAEEGTNIFEITAVGWYRGHHLLTAGFDTISVIADASADTLSKTKGIGDDPAAVIFEGAIALDTGRNLVNELAHEIGCDDDEIRGCLNLVRASGVTVEEAEKTLRGLFRQENRPSIVDVEGISGRQAYYLYEAGYHEIQQVAEATEEQLQAVPYLGASTANKAKESASEFVGA
ncbi:hypothetical protein AUR64_04065 [Haloprofundus marisrubri]|uniref:Uncharacterized protein n=2 Tax=Haloprofundus marisrubri TaxID=1514971 RepID=A0A0W1RD85_9EURY|nr:hypothetical protein AUR64_04065 [Haloprofundus marisrubri]